MFLTDFKNGVLTVACLKGEPTLLLITVDGVSVGVPFEKAGTWRARCLWPPHDIDIDETPYIPLRKAELPQGEHRTPPKGYPHNQSQYAGPHYSFPVSTKRKVHAALSYFNQHKWGSAEEKKRAARKILSAAKKFGIDVAKDDNVYRAAHD